MKLLTILLIIPAFLVISVKFFSQIIPISFNGWQTTENDEKYNKKNLYDYINGGAELYLAYEFKELVVRRFQQDSLIIEVNLFNMGTPENAFGIFHHDLEDQEVGIGQQSEYGSGWLRFWQSKYFVYIFCDVETPEIKEAILILGSLIANNIEPTEINIPLIRYLPEQGRQQKSLRYFYHPTILNYHYYISNQNILNISKQTVAIFSRYKPDQNRASLLLIQYQDPQQATTAYENFLNIYLDKAKESSIIQTENGKWTGAINHQQYISIVLDATSKDFAKHLLKKCKSNFISK